jgi:transcriptional regulator with XRE-family HTH domain
MISFVSELAITLQTFRRLRDLSQRQLAQTAGLTATYVRKIEDDSLPTLPSVDALLSLAHTLGTDAKTLLAAAGRTPSPFDISWPYLDRTRSYLKATA